MTEPRPLRGPEIVERVEKAISFLTPEARRCALIAIEELLDAIREPHQELLNCLHLADATLRADFKLTRIDFTAVRGTWQAGIDALKHEIAR